MWEQDVIELIKQRNPKGAEELLRHYGPLMRYIIKPILPSPEDQEECISEVSMRIWEKIALFDAEKGSWNSWLTTVTRNTALNRKRKNDMLNRGEELSEGFRSEVPTPEEVAIQKENKKAVYRALGKLSEKEKILFYRKYYYMQSTAQIASELGMTERAVEGRLYRLKAKLRKLLGGETDE